MCNDKHSILDFFFFFNSFLLSGSDVVTTATYQASIRGFISYLDLSPEGARELLMSGVRLAAETVERLVRDGHPAGTDTESRSLPPPPPHRARGVA